MPSKSVINNVSILQKLTRGAKEDVKGRVDKVVEFYRDRKISQYETAKKIINSLMSDNKRTATFAKKRFDKKFEQIEGRAPLNERMATNRNKKDYVVRFQLYGFDNGHKAGGQRGFKDNQGDWHNLLRMEQPIQMNLKNVRDEDKLNETLVDKYVVRDKFDLWMERLKDRLRLKKDNPNKITRKQFDELNTREAWIRETGIDATLPKRRDTKGRYKQFEVIHDTALFDKLFKRLILKHPDLKNNTNLEDYTIDISDVSNTGGSGDETKKKLKDGNEIGMYHYTINTEMDVGSDNLINAIKNKKHTDGECWINTLIDHYDETLMSSNKWESKRMTRDKVLKLMNLNEEEFKQNGASVEDMKPVFEEFKLTVRLYNCIGQKIYTYDPDKKNKNITVLFGLIKGNHIYTMNDNINSIAQRDFEKDMKISASTDFRLNSKEKPCRKYVKNKGTKFNVNFKFRISNIVGNIVVLQNVATNEKQNIELKVLRKHFIYAYCYTTHSKQGCSVDDDIVIYDWSKWYCSKNWYWTSVSRARDLNRVKFYKYDADENDLSRLRVETYFKNKVSNYIEQDKKSNRPIDDDDYVDVDFLMDMMNTQCENCNEPLVIDFEDGKISSNISCQRVNNELAHYKSNCIPMCVQCNCAFSNKILM